MELPFKYNTKTVIIENCKRLIACPIEEEIFDLDTEEFIKIDVYDLLEPLFEGLN